jgi:hypothetical protein
MSAPLSRSMECALLCYAGVQIPLWAAHTWTVATIRALDRRGYLRRGVVTPKGRRLANRIAAIRNEANS